MNWNKCAICALLLILFALSSCADSANTSTSGTGGTGTIPETESVPGNAIPTDAPRIEMLAQAYENNNIVEVPQLMLDETRENQGEINLEILSFAGDYGAYLAAPNENSWLELKCYPFYTGDFVCIVLTRALCPTEDSYGEILSLVYDYKQDKIYTLDEAISSAALDLATPEDALLAAVPQGMQIDSFRPVAFALSEQTLAADIIPNEQSLVFFYDVFLSDSGELRGGRALYIRRPDGSYEAYDGSSISSAFGSSLLALDPPLYWAQDAQG